ACAGQSVADAGPRQRDGRADPGRHAAGAWRRRSARPPARRIGEPIRGRPPARRSQVADAASRRAAAGAAPPGQRVGWEALTPEHAEEIRRGRTLERKGQAWGGESLARDAYRWMRAATA